MTFASIFVLFAIASCSRSHIKWGRHQQGQQGQQGGFHREHEHHEHEHEHEHKQHQGQQGGFHREHEHEHEYHEHEHHEHEHEHEHEHHEHEHKDKNEKEQLNEQQQQQNNQEEEHNEKLKDEQQQQTDQDTILINKMKTISNIRFGSKANRLRRPSDPFKWDNCDSPAAGWTVVNSLAITPDPITLGDVINVQTDVTVGSIINNATFSYLDLTIEFKTFVGAWLEIPCVDNLGSCQYTGPFLCGRLMNHAYRNCPHLKPYGLPCTCPFLPKRYVTPTGGLNITTKNPGISWLTDGDYYV